MPMFAVRACATLAFIAAASAARISAKENSHVHLATATKSGCGCFKEGECSSCFFAQCPLAGDAVITSVEKMEHGLTGTAWKLNFDDAPSMVLKFGKFHDLRSPVIAAQVAHRLMVPTPPVLVVNTTSCPLLYNTEIMLDTLDAGFRADIKKAADAHSAALLQEFVTKETNLLPIYDRPPAEEAVDRDRPWVQVGIIAMFDWLVGKPDLFIDWKDSKLEDKPQNAHNILASKELGTAVDIDLQMGSVQRYMNDLKSLLAALTDGTDVKWINTNILDVMPDDAFGDKAGPAKPQITLGLAYGLRDILEQGQELGELLISSYGILDVMNTNDIARLSEVAAPLEAMRGSITEDGADELCMKLEGDLRVALGKPRPKEQCCKVQCQYDTTRWMMAATEDCYGGQEQDGSYVVKKPLEWSCEHYLKRLTPLAINHKCTPACPTSVSLTQQKKVKGVNQIERDSCAVPDR